MENKTTTNEEKTNENVECKYIIDTVVRYSKKGNQYTLTLPTIFVQTLGIGKGDIITLGVNTPSDVIGIDYLIKYNHDASTKIYNSEMEKIWGKWTIDKEKFGDDEIFKPYARVFHMRVQKRKSGNYFTIALPKKFIEEGGIKKGDIFTFKINSKTDYSIRHNKEASEDSRKFDLLNEKEKLERVGNKAKIIDYDNERILKTIFELRGGIITPAKIAKIVHLHPSTVKERLMGLITMDLIDYNEIGPKKIYKLNREEFKKFYPDYELI